MRRGQGVPVGTNYIAIIVREIREGSAQDLLQPYGQISQGIVQRIVSAKATRILVKDRLLHRKSRVNGDFSIAIRLFLQPQPTHHRPLKEDPAGTRKTSAKTQWGRRGKEKALLEGRKQKKERRGICNFCSGTWIKGGVFHGKLS